MDPHTVGRVEVGLKRIEVRAVTGEISSTGSHPSITLRGTPLAIDNKVEAVGFKTGDRATLFWCARGDEESNWAAGYNHSTGKFGVSEFGINELILLPAHNFLGVVAIFGGLFSLATGPGMILVLPFSIGFFVYVKKRHKKVRRAIEAALEEIKRRDSAQPTSVAEPDLDFRLKTS
ncbi:MAG: hypothetical protein HOP16_08815 [Acidobacteria bacterium]|nr:hypothetical protein [Acidobacteriota bacterium]